MTLLVELLDFWLPTLFLLSGFVEVGWLLWQGSNISILLRSLSATSYSRTHHIWHLVVVARLCTSLPCHLSSVHSLVGLGQLSQRSQRVRSQLGQDAWHELSELLVHAVAVHSVSVGSTNSVNCNEETE